jgi:DNA polymerase I
MISADTGVYERSASGLPISLSQHNSDTTSRPRLGHPGQRLPEQRHCPAKPRIEVKRLKKTKPEYAELDAILKWMLVTCFGYTGYRNAKFGQIQVHERITALSREILLQIKAIAEGMGLDVLHGIVDCLWVRGKGVEHFKEAVERETGILTEVETYDWIAFLPMSDGFGAYNRYFGRLNTGKVKVRGVMARRGDTPEYIKRMQQELFDALGRAECLEALGRIEPYALEILRRSSDGLQNAGAEDLVIHRRISRLSYSRRCAEASVVAACQKQGIPLAPGMEIGYMVRMRKVDRQHGKA